MRRIQTFVLAALLAASALSEVRSDEFSAANTGFGNTAHLDSTGIWTDQVTWQVAAPAPINFGRAGSGVIGRYFYVFGSLTANIGLAYNINTGHWEQSTPPALGNCNWTGVAAHNTIFLIGRYGNYSYGREIQKFTPLRGGPQGTWERVADYPFAVCGVAAAWDGGNYIYTAGGSSFGRSCSEAFRYDIAANVWETILHLPPYLSLYHS